MYLSPEDLSQLDDAYLQDLEERRLRVLAVKLLGDLKALHERLGQTPSNSSRPPSSQAPWEGLEPSDTLEAGLSESKDGETSLNEDTSAGEEDDATRPSGSGSETKRPGRRPGTCGAGRTQRLVVHEERHHHPEVCAVCGEGLLASADTRVQHGHDVLDLILPSAARTALEVIQIKHVYHARRCGCGHWTQARAHHQDADADWSVALSERHLAGPLLVALICALSLRLRLSRRRTQEFLADWLGLSLSVATINQCLHEAGRAVAPVAEEQLLAEVRASALLHADETSWKEHGKLLWLWVFTSATTTLFMIGRRTEALLQQVLGTTFSGWLMSDGYAAYRRLDQRLRCLAHLQRKARGLEDSLDREAQRFGRAVREQLEAVMDSVYAAREGPPAVPLDRQHAPALKALLALCVQHSDATHAKTQALARELLNDWNSFWVVLESPELPLTNNAAERALRHWVIARRISAGTRTAQGSRVVATLASVIDTCRQRGLSPWTFIAEVMSARRQGRPAPILPAAATV
jgi:transposase